MPLPLLASIVVVLLVAGYLLYGRFLAREFGLKSGARTPAHELADGEDYVPTPRFYLLGQHFSAIAAAGPIVGPIAAAKSFGWLPCVLWIGFGVVFIGAVHDFTALIASVRHRARSIAEIVREHIGPRAWIAMMCFIWIALVYVILAFTDVTAATFVGQSEELRALDGMTVPFNRGGAVAAAAVMYLLLGVVMGLVQRFLKPKLWLVTAVFVPATLGVIWLGTKISTLLIASQMTWGVSILVYCLVASLIPVWVLLQPRGYLGGFVLYGVLAIGLFGVFFGGFDVKLPAVSDAPLAGMGVSSVFPFLFVTIACGACSGFHGLVCSGTTSKQIDRESDCRTVGYGAMLLEGLVAVIALSTVMILSKDEMTGTAGKIYGSGIATFLCRIVGDEHRTFAEVFGQMAFSTFVFDTLDVATRLGRYILQELTGAKSRKSAFVATVVTVAVPGALYLSTGPGGFQTFWTLFGTSNQLLASLTLLGIVVWLRRSGRRSWYVAVPMVLVMTTTVWSLILQVMDFWGRRSQGGANVANAAVGVTLLALALFFVAEAIRALRKPPAAPALAAAGA